ncbi:MAG: trigger factor [Arthrospira sp. PLM2.Bin9]|nr:trigger factor [Arthrospira sp. PLM2.Bin9]TVU55185.1 MAG: trigger factor [Arthrospira sp. PLM2.Bin9]
MKVTQEKLPASQIGLDIEISPEISKNAYEKVINQYARSANIPGFRKGKVPRHILVQRLGASRIKAAALDDLMQEYFPKIVEEEKIPAIGSFEVVGNIEELIEQYEPGQPITIKAAVDVEPEVKLNKYQDFQVQAEEVKFDPQQVDEILERERVKMATLVPVENRPAQKGDTAYVDFKGYFTPKGATEPEEIEGGQGDNYQVELTEGQFIPGFTEGIEGMSPGETKELNIEFPADYGKPELAGCPATFTITLLELKEKELPELDDDFAAEVSEFETLAELRESLEKRFQEEKAEQTTSNKHKALAEALVAEMEVELPETLVKEEVDRLLTQQAMQLSNMGIDLKQLFNSETVPRMREHLRPDAIAQLKETLAIKEVAKQQSITVTEEEIQAKCEEMMEQLQGQEVNPERLRMVVTDDLISKKTYQWIEEHSTIELVPEGTLTPEEEEPEDSEDSEEVVVAEAEVVTD